MTPTLDAEKPDQALRPLRLLVVDDSPDDAALNVAVLRRSGLSCSAQLVDSPEMLRQQLEQSSFDIILCDHNIGSWTGLDALEILKRSGKDIPFIVVTGSLGDETAVEYVKRGAAEYVLKGNSARLPAAVGRALHEKQQRDQAAHLQAQVFAGKKEWELTFDAVTSPILILEGDCRILRANRAASQVLGLPFSGLIGHSCCEALHGEKEPPEGCPHRHFLETGEPIRGDYEEMRLHKSFDMSCAPLRNPGGLDRSCVVVMRDITGRKLLEQQLAQAQKMEAIGRLAGGIAHDFNNLITIITGYSQVVLGRLAENAPMRAAVEEIRKAGDRAASLTKQLLAFSRRQMFQPQVLDLNVVVTNVEKMLRRLIGEDIDLTVKLGAGLGWIKADPGQIEQVLMNLAVNARDAMPHGGKLLIETANEELTEAHARNHGEVTPGPCVMFAVSDNGCGMDAETQSHIFEPFYTTKELGKGTGLGLSTVYGIVKQSGGNLWVYSEPGVGTTFKIYLPRVREQARSVAAPEVASALKAATETVLVVEDEEALRALVRGVLTECGYRVLDPGGSQQAITLAESHRDPIHLLLTDVIMPRMDGRELAQQVSRLHPETLVLYMSGYTDNAIVHHGVLEAGTAFLEKPFTPEGLVQKVRQLLASPKSSLTARSK